MPASGVAVEQGEGCMYVKVRQMPIWSTPRAGPAAAGLWTM